MHKLTKELLHHKLEGVLYHSVTKRSCHAQSDSFIACVLVAACQVSLLMGTGGPRYALTPLCTLHAYDVQNTCIVHSLTARCMSGHARWYRFAQSKPCSMICTPVQWLMCARVHAGHSITTDPCFLRHRLLSTCELASIKNIGEDLTAHACLCDVLYPSGPALIRYKRIPECRFLCPADSAHWQWAS